MLFKKIVFILFLFLGIRLILEFFIFLNFESHVHNTVLQLKYKLISPIFLDFEGLSYKQQENIRIFRFSFKNEQIEEEIFTQIGKDYFFFTKIAFAIPEDIFKDLKRVNLEIGNKKFSYSKKELLNKWRQQKDTFNNRKIGNGLIVFTAPDNVKTNSIIPKLLFFSPQLSSIINWNDYALLIFTVFFCTHFLFPFIF